MRDHLFVTTRVHIKDGNFLIGAPFDSDRSRHLVVRPKKSVLGAPDVFRPFSTFLGIFSCLFHVFVWGGLRKSREKTVFWYSRCVGRALLFQGSPFCHHEGRHKRWEFLNRCTFRFRSTPSSLFPTQKIGFGAAGRFWTFFGLFRPFFRLFRVFFVGGTCANPGKKKVCWQPDV